MVGTWRRSWTKCQMQTLKAVLGPSALYPYHAPPADRRFLTGFLTILMGWDVIRRLRRGRVDPLQSAKSADLFGIRPNNPLKIEG